MGQHAKEESGKPLRDRSPQLLRCLSGTWDAKNNWSTNRREAFAVVEALRKCPFLEDAPTPIVAYSDNASVVGLFNAGAEAGTQAKQGMLRLAEEALSYSLRVEHIPGEENYLPD